MASEVEIKLELAAGVADQIARLPWLRDLISGPAVTKQLVSVYFDTAKQKLRAHGLTLRVRQVGNKHLQTIKTADLGTHGAFGRDEWEHEVADTRPDLTRAEGTALEKLATPTLERKLRPVFETVIERTAIPLHYDGAALELALDRGVIHGNGSREAVDEVEIELKQGDPAVLAAVAERLARSVPVSFGVRTKSERGYALCNGEAGEAVPAAPILLDRAATVGDAFTAIGLSCFKHIVSNREAVIAGRAEGVHEMRAGLRRLRAAIAIFKHLLRDAEAKSVKRELKWLAGLLERGVARKAVESDRFRELGLRTALWLANGAWSRGSNMAAQAERGRPAIDFAAEELARRTQRIVKKLSKLAPVTPSKRHTLDSRIRKLRYACEFFASLFDRKNHVALRRKFEKILAGLQASLGRGAKNSGRELAAAAPFWR